MFRNRAEAALLLARRLAVYHGRRPLVLAIPRGAVPMAHTIAARLQGEPNVVLVKKLRHPTQPELAIGSIDERGEAFLTDYGRGVDSAYLEAERTRQLQTLKHRRRLYTNLDLPPVDPRGRIVIIVDDGIATGSTMIAALHSIRAQAPEKLIVAVGVAPHSTVAKIEALADEVVCLESPVDFYAVGQFFEDFSEVTDEDVAQILKAEAATPADPEVEIALNRGVVLHGNLQVPRNPRGLVIFAHGSGSSRHSPRNRYVADYLFQAGIATLLFDLLTPAEDRVYEARFDIELLADRLADVTRWIGTEPRIDGSPIFPPALPPGYFGASTGAAAAIMAAASLRTKIACIVSRGGRPDLAQPEALAQVTAPTLLIVGSRDEPVLQLNQKAAEQLRCPHELHIVEGATHLFEEPGALDEVAEVAARWFGAHFIPATSVA